MFWWILHMYLKRILYCYWTEFSLSVSSVKLIDSVQVFHILILSTCSINCDCGFIFLLSALPVFVPWICRSVTRSTHLFKFFFFFTFIYLWKTETERKWEMGRERGRQRIRSRLQALAVSTEPDAGLELTNCEIMTWAEVGHPANWATQAPLHFSHFWESRALSFFFFFHQTHLMLKSQLMLTEIFSANLKCRGWGVW